MCFNMAFAILIFKERIVISYYVYIVTQFLHCVN